MRECVQYVIEQNQKSFSYFMDRSKHNMNFSKANDRNNTNAINKFTTLNIKVNISMRTYTLQIPIDHTVLKKRKKKISVRHPHTCATEQSQKSKCVFYGTNNTQHKLFKSK